MTLDRNDPLCSRVPEPNQDGVHGGFGRFNYCMMLLRLSWVVSDRGFERCGYNYAAAWKSWFTPPARIHTPLPPAVNVAPVLYLRLFDSPTIGHWEVLTGPYGAAVAVWLTSYHQVEHGTRSEMTVCLVDIQGNGFLFLNMTAWATSEEIGSSPAR